MISRLRICLGLAALFGANLFVVSAFVWLTETWLRGHRWTGPLVGGMLFAQIMSLGLWLALGDAKWYWRLALAAFATLLLVEPFVWAERLTSKPRREDDSYESWITLVFMCVLLISAMGLWPLRNLGQWRLTWRRDLALPQSARQFHTGDLLLWTALIGGVLASFRLLQSITGENDSGWIKFIFLALCVLLLMALAASAAFATNRAVRRYMILWSVTLLFSGLYIGLDTWDRLQVIIPSAAPWQTRLWPTLRDSLKESLPLICASVVGLTNCLGLRFLGCQLSRPHSTSAGALMEEYNSG